MPTRGATADIGYFATVEWDGDTFRFVDACEVGNFTADVVETTASGGLDKFKTFMAGLADAGEVVITINHDPDNPVEYDGVTRTLTVNFPPAADQETGATFECAAFLSAAPVSVPSKDRMTQAVTWKLSGKPTFTPGAA